MKHWKGKTHTGVGMLYEMAVTNIKEWGVLLERRTNYNDIRENIRM